MKLSSALLNVADWPANGEWYVAPKFPKRIFEYVAPIVAACRHDVRCAGGLVAHRARRGLTRRDRATDAADEQGGDGAYGD